MGIDDFNILRPDRKDIKEAKENLEIVGKKLGIDISSSRIDNIFSQSKAGRNMDQKYFQLGDTFDAFQSRINDLDLDEDLVKAMYTVLDSDGTGEIEQNELDDVRALAPSLYDGINDDYDDLWYLATVTLNLSGKEASKNQDNNGVADTTEDVTPPAATHTPEVSASPEATVAPQESVTPEASVTPEVTPSNDKDGITVPGLTKDYPSKNDEVTVTTWGKKPADGGDQNDCLLRIIQNNYGKDIKYGTDEYWAIANEVMKANPEIYDSGRKIVGGTNKDSSVIYTGETIKLPNLRAEGAEPEPEAEVQDSSAPKIVPTIEGGRPVGTQEITEKDGIVTTVTKDNDGKITGTTKEYKNESGYSVSENYDANGVIKNMIQKDQYGRTASYESYDKNGNLTGGYEVAWDPNDNSPDASRMEVSLKDGKYTTKSYVKELGAWTNEIPCDQNGQLTDGYTSKVDDGGRTTIIYDQNNKPVTETHQNGNVVQYVKNYNDDGSYTVIKLDSDGKRVEETFNNEGLPLESENADFEVTMSSKDLADIANKLYFAMKGVGTDEKTVNDIILNGNYSSSELVQIMSAYEELRGTPLMEDIQGDFSGGAETKLREKLYNALQEEVNNRTEYDTNPNAKMSALADEFYKEFNSSDATGFMEKLMNSDLSDSEIVQVLTAYANDYGENPMTQITEGRAWFGKEDGYVQKIMNAYLNEVTGGKKVLSDSTPESAEASTKEVEAPELLSDRQAEVAVNKLFTAIDGWGTDEKTVNDIILNSNYTPAQLVQVMKLYNEKHGESLMSAIQGDFSGGAETKLREKLYEALQSEIDRTTTYSEKPSSKAMAIADEFYKEFQSMSATGFMSELMSDKYTNAERVQILSAYKAQYGENPITKITDWNWFGKEDGYIDTIMESYLSEL